MSRRQVKKVRLLKKEWIVTFPFFIVVLALILFRLVYDVKTFFCGSTIVFYRQEYQDYDYLLHLPPQYHDFYGKRPLLVYLHGAGEVGKDVKILDEFAPYHFLKSSREEIDFPFIVVCPLCEKNGWEPKRIVRMINNMIREKRFRWSCFGSLQE